MRNHDRTSPSTPAAVSARRRIAAGVNDSMSAGLGIFPLGIAMGLLVVQSGLPWWVAPALSAAMFAGSVELLLVGMLAATTPLATIALTVLLVNFRHVFYAFSFPLHLVGNPAAKAFAVYALVDEVYAVNAALPSAQRSAARLLAMQAACLAYWVGGGLLGLGIAAILPGPIEGLEFALCALFTVLTLDALRSRAEVPSLLLAAAGLAIALVLTPESAVFTALVLFTALLALRHAIGTRRANSARRATAARHRAAEESADA